MLTVRYGWLGVRPGDRVLDLGSGFGRHAYEAARRGAVVTAVDLADAELKEVANTFAAMVGAGEVTADRYGGVAQADATRLPFPDAAVDRVIASEVFEHIPDDAAAMTELARVVRPGGTIAVTVPAYLPERICWVLADDYHAPAVPGGHVRIYTEAGLRALMRTAGLRPGAAHHAHALHSPYWWLRCAVGPTKDQHAAVRAYRRLLEWDIVRRPVVTQVVDRLLNPVLGKSLVVYATRPGEA
jgi:SAM-dependent methyltransferase